MRFKVDKKLSVYQNKMIIIFGASDSGRTMFSLLKHHALNVAGFCDNDPLKWGKKLYDLPVLSPKDLFSLNKDQYCIQIASIYEMEIAEQLQSMGVDDFIGYREGRMVLEGLWMYGLSQSDPERYSRIIKVLTSYSTIINFKDEAFKNFYKLDMFKSNMIILCMPPKTGDHTMQNSIEKYAPDSFLFNTIHSAYAIKDMLSFVDNQTPVKMISAVRDPISQNLSLMFEALSFQLYDLDSFWDDEDKFDNLFREFVSVYAQPKTGDFRHRIEALLSNEKSEQLIQRFFDNNFCCYLDFDIYSVPFDKEAGYSIIHIGNIELFLYQLERLNDIHRYLYEFLGIDPQNPLVNGNEAKNKWYYDYYKEAQKTIKFSKEYFDWSFNSPYLKHFYSEEDINKFKARWSSHII